MKKISQRFHRAIERMIGTAPDLESNPDKFAIEMTLAAMSGAMRSVLEAGGSPTMMRINLCRRGSA
jgi:hypothetical protein